ARGAVEVAARENSGAVTGRNDGGAGGHCDGTNGSGAVQRGVANSDAAGEGTIDLERAAVRGNAGAEIARAGEAHAAGAVFVQARGSEAGIFECGKSDVCGNVEFGRRGHGIIRKGSNDEVDGEIVWRNADVAGDGRASLGAEEVQRADRDGGAACEVQGAGAGVDAAAVVERELRESLHLAIEVQGGVGVDGDGVAADGI